MIFQHYAWNIYFYCYFHFYKTGHILGSGETRSKYEQCHMECVVCAYTTSNGPLISSNCCKNLVCAHPLFTFRYLVCFSMCTYIILHPLFTFKYLVYFVYFGMCTFLCLFLSLFWYVQVLASKNRLNSLQCMFWYVHKIVMIYLDRTQNWDPPTTTII